MHHITALRPWHAFLERNISIRGLPHNQFHLDTTNDSADVAMLELGAIIDTARAWINENRIPPLDPTKARADIEECLQQVTNIVETVVSTTLRNVLRTMWKESKSSGTL
ncbi:hypothetical protein DOTSEDRAFT_68417 [Dothistroma septosporum NZE10]|uniref:Uncharacterized protein n=1 Tax=Dothistroma septosporum (strain NZE10 / CBS 128990) TaxID=675120 RepID=N1Q1R8_DOTSN|nr:hypothetical protein DOTSEDRAFT_68417 [Dothistroma septosporum NZE10]